MDFVELKLNVIDDVPRPRAHDPHQEFYARCYGVAWIKVQEPRNLREQYKCLLCGMLCQYIQRIYTHINVHLKVRRYRCAYCEKAFFSKSMLCKHVGCCHHDRNGPDADQ